MAAANNGRGRDLCRTEESIVVCCLLSVVFPGKKLFYYEVEDPEQEGF